MAAREVGQAIGVFGRLWPCPYHVPQPCGYANEIVRSPPSDLRQHFADRRISFRSPVAVRGSRLYPDLQLSAATHALSRPPIPDRHSSRRLGFPAAPVEGNGGAGGNSTGDPSESLHGGCSAVAQ